MQLDIIHLAEATAACSAVICVIIAAYKLYDKLLDRVDRLEEKAVSLEAEIRRVKKEDAIVIYALRACLDGLHQQGCNGRVTEAIDKIDKHINQAAHKQD